MKHIKKKKNCMHYWKIVKVQGKKHRNHIYLIFCLREEALTLLSKTKETLYALYLVLGFLMMMMQDKTCCFQNVLCLTWSGRSTMIQTRLCNLRPILLLRIINATYTPSLCFIHHTSFFLLQNIPILKIWFPELIFF